MRLKLALGGGYLALLAASHAWQHFHVPAPREDVAPEQGRVRVDVPAMGDAGPIAGSTTHVSLLHWSPASNTAAPRTPVLMVHGSPGAADNFDSLGPVLASRGFDAWAIDLPGFGETWGDTPSYSILAHARAALAALDALGIERAHLLAWSMGGGVILHMAELEPARVASMSMVAAIGVQEGEGSGSYAFEHLKYACLYAGLIVLPELLPHFGWVQTSGEVHSFVRNFWDTDQRPLRNILASTNVPILIVHGRDDFLVPVWTARKSHELARDSRLAVVDGSHFLPFTGANGNEETVAELDAFLSRHDAAGVAEARSEGDLRRGAPPEKRALFGRDLDPFAIPMNVPWWLQFAAFGVAARFARRTAAITAALLCLAIQVDLGVALIAVCAGAACAPGSIGRRCLHVAAAVGWFALASIAGGLALYWTPHEVSRSWVVAVLVAIVGALTWWLARRRTSRELVAVSN